MKGFHLPGLKEWYGNAYTYVTEIAEKPLLCEPMYVEIYLTWANFAVKFIVPTIILIGCNIKIIAEVSMNLYYYNLQIRGWVHFMIVFLVINVSLITS